MYNNKIYSMVCCLNPSYFNRKTQKTNNELLIYNYEINLKNKLVESLD